VFFKLFVNKIRGGGKTTLLKHLLNNPYNLKIAIIVNDVASINIDSKLIRSGSSEDVIQLQNGCACCSLSGELMSSLAELVTLSDMRGGEDEGFDHIVIEVRAWSSLFEYITSKVLT